MTRFALVSLPILIPLAGCATNSSGPHNDVAETTSSRSGYVLRIDGESAILGQTTPNSLSLPVFIARVQSSVTSSQDYDTGQLVRTYPDLASQAVLSHEVDPRTQQVIAAWMDSFATPAPGGWSSLVADRAENPGRYAAWTKQRASAWKALRRGAFAEAAESAISVPDGGPTPWPAMDAESLRATAMLAAGRPGDAAPLFERSAQAASAWDPRVSVRANLYAALSYRLAGIPSAASDARSKATSLASLSEIQDPMVLRLLLETHESSSTSLDGFSRRATRARLGRVEMERGAPQAALLAFRAAETEPGAKPDLNRLRLSQAEALIGLSQDQPAIAMLVGLARTAVRSEALVMLGLLQLRRGQRDMALAVLREAVEAATAHEQPAVYADAGLALLSAGDQKVGLSLLDKAGEAYRARGDNEALGQLLRNELRYAKAIDDTALVSHVQQKLLDIDLSHGEMSGFK